MNENLTSLDAFIKNTVKSRRGRKALQDLKSGIKYRMQKKIERKNLTVHLLAAQQTLQKMKTWVRENQAEIQSKEKLIEELEAENEMLEKYQEEDNLWQHTMVSSTS